MDYSSIELKREAIIDFLLFHGWKPNIRYFTCGKGHGCKPDERGKGGYYGYHYLLSAENTMNLTIKPMAIIVHDVTQSYKKVLSMKIEKVVVGENGIQDGNRLIHH
jgi:hypothetical protein